MESIKKITFTLVIFVVSQDYIIFIMFDLKVPRSTVGNMFNK